MRFPFRFRVRSQFSNYLRTWEYAVWVRCGAHNTVIGYYDHERALRVAVGLAARPVVLPLPGSLPELVNYSKRMVSAASDIAWR